MQQPRAPGGSTALPAFPASLSTSTAVGRHGNTAKGRLDRLDALLRIYEPQLFQVQRVHPGSSPGLSAGGTTCDVCVDVGFGDTVDTLVDFATRLGPRRTEGTLRVIGTESDPRRLAAGRASMGAKLQDSSLALRQAESDGWFVLPLQEDEPSPVFIRALNVLRDYHPADARRGLLTLGAQLAHGGLLMEGSASTPGHTAVVMLARRAASGANSTVSASAGDTERTSVLKLEALCFCVDFDRRDTPKLRGPPNRWFSRQIPQIWQHQNTKAGDHGKPWCSGAARSEEFPAGDHENCVGQSSGAKKRKRGGDRKWLGGGG